MKKILQILVILLLINCGTRKKDLEIRKETTELKSENSGTQTEISETKSETSIDYAKYLQEIGFNIKSNGTDYRLEFGDFKFYGNADVNLSNKKEETKTKVIQKVKITYKSVITYKTETVYKSKTTDKNLQVESKRSEFAWYILSAFLGMAFIIAIQVLWKSYGGGIVERFKNGKIKF